MLLGVAMLSACVPVPEPAHYAGWEPMPMGVPSAPSRSVARERLADSRALWHAFRDGPTPDVQLTGRPSDPRSQRGYSYVRARQASPERVEFTLFSVERGRVVLRAFVAGHPDALKTGGERNHALESLWAESAADLGQHPEGAPPHSIDELYAECERWIAEHSTSPRLYFHPDGLLMHCGFDPDDCRGCPEISIQSVSRFTLDRALRTVEPARWVCARDWGVFFPGSSLFVHGSDEVCYAPPNPRPQTLRTSSVARGSHESCPLGPELCEPVEPSEASLKDICQIDPAACPKPCDADGCTTAHWARRLSPCPAWPRRAPQPLELGKPEPLAPWSFPFSTGGEIECGRRTTLLRVIQPRLPEELGPARF